MKEHLAPLVIALCVSAFFIPVWLLATSELNLEGTHSLLTSVPAVQHPAFVETLEDLRSLADPGYDVMVRGVDLSGRGALGVTQWIEDEEREGGGYFLIRVHGSMCVSMGIHVLIHEWAHVLVFDAGAEDVEDHGPIWGAAYSQCYQAGRLGLGPRDYEERDD